MTQRTCWGVTGVFLAMAMGCSSSSSTATESDGGHSDAPSNSVDGGGTLDQILTESMFNAAFPNKLDRYRHTDLIAAATKYFPTFGTEGTSDQRRREVAAFLAHKIVETQGLGWNQGDLAVAGGLMQYEELNARTAGVAWHHYREADVTYPPYGPEDGTIPVGSKADGGSGVYILPPDRTVRNQPGVKRTYIGRGPIQVSYNYNYGQFSAWYFGERANAIPTWFTGLYTDGATIQAGQVLVRDPDIMLDPGNEEMLWASALWFWMTAQPPKPSPHDVMVGRWVPSTGDVTAGRTADRPFAVTTDIVNGGVECSGVSCGGNIPVCYPSSAISNTSVVGPPRGTPGVERGWAKLQTWGRGIAYSRFCTVLTTQPLSTEVALDDRVCGDMRPY